MSNRNDLKAAISTLKVNKPLRVGSQLETPSDQFEPPSRKSEIEVNSDQFDLRPFTPEITKYAFLETNEGVFQIPHKIFEWVHKVIDTKVELLVFNCLLRYTLGFRRTRCEASQSFIAKWTGIASPNVRRALRELLAKGHIKRIESGTLQHESAVYEVPIVVAYLDFMEKKKSQIKSNSDQSDPSAKKSEMYDQNKLSSEIKLISKKETKINSKKTLSSQVLENYFEKIYAPKKKESETNFLEGLLENFAEIEIEKCFLFVMRHGDLKNKEPVHSPMAYLATCIDEVRKKINISSQSESSELLKQQQRIFEEIKAQHDYQKKESAFLATFPDIEAQNRIIEELCKIHAVGLSLRGIPARSVAIQSWWDGLSKDEKNHLAKEAL